MEAHGPVRLQFALRPDCFPFVLSAAKLSGIFRKLSVPLPAKNEKRNAVPQSLTMWGFFAFDCLELFSRNSHRIQYNDNPERRANV